ncbi:MAG TPA: hypothetical protein VF026_00190 [Ktedonobacteraceae bacterium]
MGNPYVDAPGLHKCSSAFWGLDAASAPHGELATLPLLATLALPRKLINGHNRDEQRALCRSMMICHANSDGRAC